MNYKKLIRIMEANKGTDCYLSVDQSLWVRWCIAKALGDFFGKLERVD